MHQRMLSDFDRVRRRARVTVLGEGDGMDLNPMRVENLIERERRADVALLRDKRRRLVRESGVHYMQLRSWLPTDD